MLFASSLLVSCGFQSSDCSEKSPAVAYARSLPAERLARIYEDAKQHAESGPRLYGAGPNAHNPGAQWLSDIEYNNIMLDGARSRIMLEGCLDEYVVITIHGVPGIYADDPPALILSWDDRPTGGSEVLWQEPGSRQ